MTFIFPIRFSFVGKNEVQKSRTVGKDADVAFPNLSLPALGYKDSNL